MSNIVELKTRPAEVSESVISRIEEALAAAREGKITTVAIACVNADGSIGCSWSDTDDFPRLLGSIARMEYRVNVRQSVE